MMSQAHPLCTGSVSRLASHAAFFHLTANLLIANGLIFCVDGAFVAYAIAFEFGWVSTDKIGFHAG